MVGQYRIRSIGSSFQMLKRKVCTVESSQLIWRSRSLVHERLNYLILSFLCNHLRQ